jgi:hypothetical protein
MTLLTALVTDPSAHRLAWTLVHFLWQGALVGALAFITMRWIASTASARYLTGVSPRVALALPCNVRQLIGAGRE